MRLGRGRWACRPPLGPLKQAQINLHDLVLVIITLITLFVAGLLVWVMWRYNAKRNPVPSRPPQHVARDRLDGDPGADPGDHGDPVLPPDLLRGPPRDADLTIKVTGHQWYWEYTYPDKNNIDFSSYIIPDDQLKPGQLRLLDGGQPACRAGWQEHPYPAPPAADVIHSFFIPSLGVQRYAIPGRTIETWFRADKPGVFYGECNQICGTNHSRMPIVVRAVTPAGIRTLGWSRRRTKFADATRRRRRRPRTGYGAARRARDVGRGRTQH